MNYNLDTDDSLLGDSTIAGFLRYPNIWYKFFDENTINWSYSSATISLEYVVISCGTDNLDTGDYEKKADGLFCIALAPSKKE